jgi:hypothetical protein
MLNAHKVSVFATSRTVTKFPVVVLTKRVNHFCQLIFPWRVNKEQNTPLLRHARSRALVLLHRVMFFAVNFVQNQLKELRLSLIFLVR